MYRNETLIKFEYTSTKHESFLQIETGFYQIFTNSAQFLYNITKNIERDIFANIPYFWPLDLEKMQTFTLFIYLLYCLHLIYT